MRAVDRPFVRVALAWLGAIAAYALVAHAEGMDEARRHPRDERASERRADLLAAHVTDAVGRARDAERGRLGALCAELETAGVRALEGNIAAGSALRDLWALRPSDEVVLAEHRGATGGPPLAWPVLRARAPLLAGSASLRGVERGLATVFPSDEGLGIVRLGCAAVTPEGSDIVVVGHLDVVALAAEALPASVASVRLEREEDRTAGLRRWLGPAGDGPRPALRVRLEGPGTAEVYPVAPAVAALLVALAVFAGLRPRPARALTALEAAALRVGAGDLDVTIEPEGGPADGTFSAFNRMTRELKRAQLRLTRAERIAAWREVAQRIAHEIKNPLTPIRTAIETLRKAKQRQHAELDEIFEESTAAVLEEVQRMERIVGEFSRFARMPRPAAALVSLREAAAHVVQVHALPAEVTQPESQPVVAVELAVEGDLPRVRADHGQIVQVLTNLVQNGIDAAHASPTERRRVLVLLVREEGGARIEVHDGGGGIPDAERERVLAPYHTTKPHGTGLGLAIVERIVADHGGRLAIGRSERLGGALVTVHLTEAGPPDEAAASHPAGV